uniref:Trehalase n=1 Tax=Ampulex compressa TaxID=860918 RepID=A0A1W6EWF5_AMPCP|nr:trehalase-like protein [Ampulex compressa]
MDRIICVCGALSSCRIFQKAQHYAKIAESWQEAIDNVLWNEESGIWFDYDIKNNKVRKSFYPSNLVPLYTRSYDKKNGAKYAQRAVAYLHREKIDTFFGKSLHCLLLDH